MSGESWTEQGDQQQQRIKVVAFVGVMTGFTTPRTDRKYNYEDRRAALRETWFPANPQQAQRLESSIGVSIRFVVGRHPKGDTAADAAMDEEERLHGCFLRLPLKEHYLGLPRKVLAFMRAALAGWDFEYLLKVDDDVYLRPDRVPPMVRQWQQEHADYIGCMKQGVVFKDKSQRWFEPQHALLGNKYFTHAWGSAYSMSVSAARAVVAVPSGLLRFFSNEDVTVGSWMMAFNATHTDDRRMCEPDCSSSSVVVYDYPDCAGLCNPAPRLRELHASAACALPAVDTATGELPTKPRAFWFAPTPTLE